jgi:uncharacterized protein YutE (UPF0331/DUF86 family)
MTDLPLIEKRLAVIDTCVSDLRARLADMAGFQNVLVHGYDDVNLDVVRNVLKNHLVDLERFTAGVRQRL